METNQPKPPEGQGTPPPVRDDLLGGCPVCGGNDGVLNVRRANWVICHAHRTRWLRGENFFRAWRFETPAIWEENGRVLARYREVAPLFAAPTSPEDAITEEKPPRRCSRRPFLEDLP